MKKLRAIFMLVVVCILATAVFVGCIESGRRGDPT